MSWFGELSPLQAALAVVIPGGVLMVLFLDQLATMLFPETKKEVLPSAAETEVSAIEEDDETRDLAFL